MVVVQFVPVTTVLAQPHATKHEEFVVAGKAHHRLQPICRLWQCYTCIFADAALFFNTAAKFESDSGHFDNWTTVLNAQAFPCQLWPHQQVQQSSSFTFVCSSIRCAANAQAAYAVLAVGTSPSPDPHGQQKAIGPCHTSPPATRPLFEHHD